MSSDKCLHSLNDEVQNLILRADGHCEGNGRCLGELKHDSGGVGPWALACGILFNILAKHDIDNL